MTTLGEGIAADMAEQPAVVARLLAGRQWIAEELWRRHLRPRRGIVLVARGSSDHAAIYARYLLELVVRVPVALAAPSLYTRYHSSASYEGWLALGISQSGATPEIVTTLETLAAHGARTIALTNDVSSPLGQAAELTVPLGCGLERGVPATKTFLGSLAAVAALARAIVPDAWSDGDEQRLVEALAELVGEEPPLGPIVDALVRAVAVTHLGRGFTLPVALEGALKQREMTGRFAEGLSAPDYLHGPLAATGVDSAVVAHLGDGPTGADVAEAARVAGRRGAAVVVVASAGVEGGAEALAVPRLAVEPLAALAGTVRAQQLALACARRLGVDPDRPGGLRKVTPTT